MEIYARSPSEETTTKGREKLPSLTVADLNDRFGYFIISAEMPFTVVKIPEFITFYKANPNYVLPSIYKLKNNILRKKREIGDERFARRVEAKR